MKLYGIFITLALIIVATCGLMAHLMDKSEAADAVRAQAWLTFSMQHHCRIIREQTFWTTNSVWQCDDGFQVVRP